MGSNSGEQPPAVLTDNSSALAQRCAADNPYRADATSGTTTSTLAVEKQWIRAYLNEAYLWFDSMPSVDATAPDYSGSSAQLDNRQVPLPLSNYFNALKTRQTTFSGALTDRFSFTYPTRAWQQLSQSGVAAGYGYGIEWIAINSTAPNRVWRVALVQPNSPAAAAGLLRGDTLKTVDGVDFANGSNFEALNSGLYPANGATHGLVFSRMGSADVSANLTGTSITIDPVPLATVVTDPAGRKVGYLHFTDHLATSEARLITAVASLKAQNISDLVLDLRYNGGGYLYIASELTYMIAGPARVSGKYFEKLQYNIKRAADNAQAAIPFYKDSCLPDFNGNCTTPQALPTLDLARIFVITTRDTCSASESVINGLRGIDVDVQLIGGTTCGKPYGYVARDNCGVSYFPVEFKGINFKGFGDYADGFSPSTGAPTPTSPTGCSITDDLDSPLGSTSERMLSTALNRAATGACPAKQTTSRQSFQPIGRMQRDSVREMRVLTGTTGSR
jgi:carboxyl-terminal processing protease